ncbi:MAG TPA: hypothetical protein VMW87_15675 [Spirochaetia bacterium]|nr:hypothetical protein [Spirochaetia bacterium]
MKERWIFFRAPILEAVRNGAKTQTRRIRKSAQCPFGKPGDVLRIPAGPVTKHVRLRIIEIKSERLQEINETDAEAEGVCFGMLSFSSPRDAFCDAWKSLFGPESWDENPEVWVIRFELLR